MTWVGHRGGRRPAGGRRRSRRAARSDTGSTLAEVVISIGVLGTAGVGLLFALITAVKGAGEHQRLATTRARLGAAVELVQSTGIDYVACSTTPAAVATAYRSALATELAAGPTTVDVGIDQVTFWDGNAFVATCTGVPPDALQLVDVTATNGNLSVHQSVTKLPGPVVP